MDFATLISASMEELVELLDGVAPASSLEALYGHALLAYQRADLARLEQLRAKASGFFADHPDLSRLLAAIDLRLALRTRKINQSLLAAELPLVKEHNPWNGELCILLATAYTVLGQHKEAHGLYEKSVQEFERSGNPRKAFKARLNVLVAESHLVASANLIPKYFDLYRRAMKKDQRDEAVATVCLLNISREYQLLGSLHAALKYVTQALVVAEANFGTQAYYLALAHRAHLLCELERFPEARVDYDCAVAGNFPEVQAALLVVKELLEPHYPDLAQIPMGEPKEDHLLPAWKSRRGERGRPALSPLENKLVEFLSAGPRPRPDILDHLYGAKLSFEVKLNRFKSLIGNLRRKSPHLLLCEEGNYRLAEVIVPLRKGRAK
jgi:tetratricopeptide (TPR) repeat protein